MNQKGTGGLIGNDRPVALSSDLRSTDKQHIESLTSSPCLMFSTCWSSYSNPPAYSKKQTSLAFIHFLKSIDSNQLGQLLSRQTIGSLDQNEGSKGIDLFETSTNPSKIQHTRSMPEHWCQEYKFTKGTTRLALPLYKHTGQSFE